MMGLQNADANDATNEVFAKLLSGDFAKFDRREHKVSLRPWLHAVTRNVCLDLIRRRGRELSLDPTVLDARPSEDRHDEQDATNESVESWHLIRTAAEDVFVGRTERDFFERYVSSFSKASICDEMGITPGYFDTLKSRTIAKLRHYFEDLEPDLFLWLDGRRAKVDD